MAQQIKTQTSVSRQTSACLEGVNKNSTPHLVTDQLFPLVNHTPGGKADGYYVGSACDTTGQGVILDGITDVLHDAGVGTSGDDPSP